MKTLTILIALLSLISCSKENTSNITKPNDALSQVKSIDVTDQRTVFSLLTPREKTELASEHLDYCIETMGLTSTQRNVLTQIKSLLYAIYSSHDPENTQEMASIQLDISQYFSNMTEDQLAIIFDSMVTHDSSEMPTYNPDKGTACGCSSTSNYCSSSPYGPRIKCDVNACSIQSSWGCGTLWGYACNGKCNLFSS